jgi:GDP-4-dehydro-6-deoxy-D-mannose reductase
MPPPAQSRGGDEAARDLVSEIVAEPAPPLSGRIAITGAAGFVGKWLRWHLDELAGNAVEVVPILHRGSEDDIRDRNSVAEAVRAARPDAVVHLAAIAAPAEARRSPHMAWEVNVMGTLNLAPAVLEHAPDALLVHVGSSEAYGDSFAAAASALDEDAPLLPRTVYGATKAAADLMIGQMTLEGLRAVRFRPFNHAGPGQSADYVVSAFAQQIALIEKGLRPPVIEVGNLDVEREILDVRDVVSAYVRAVARPDAAAGGVFNVAAGRPARIGAVLETLLGLSGAEVEVRVDPGRFRPDEVPTVSGDARRAEELLGWRPRIPLRAMLADVLQYWREHPEAAQD